MLRAGCGSNLQTIHNTGPLDVIHTFSSLDVVAQEGFSLLLLSGEVIRRSLCSPTIPQAHPAAPSPSAPLGVFE